jgi:ATP-dependent helicase HepA
VTGWKSTSDKGPANQVLLFAQDRPVVEELGVVIQTRLPGISVQMFHHGMDEADLAHTALQFQRNQDCRILVSDELGGEGRNFQNAGAVLHFDLPWSVARLEQRIGRLDWVGRGADRPIESFVVLGPTAVESTLFDIHDRVFRVFTRSVGGLEYALPHMQRALNEALCRGRDALNALVASLSEQVRQELEEVDEAFELSLDASKHQLGSAEELAEWLSDSGNDPESATTLAKWADRLGIATRVRADQTSDFKWTADSLLRHPSGLRTEGFISGIFSRQRALDDESQQFLSPGHPLVDALMEDMETSAEGRACVMAMHLGASYRGRLFALVLVRSDLDEQRFSGDRLPHGLRLRARRFYIPDVQVALVELYPGDEPAAAIVDDPDLLRLLRNPNHIEPRYHKVGPNSLGTNLDTLSLWAAVEEALPLTVEHVRRQRKGIPEEGASQLADDLRQEISFLTWKRLRQPDGEREALDDEIAARLALVDSVRHEYLGVEAVAVIVALP